MPPDVAYRYLGRSWLALWEEAQASGDGQKKRWLAWVNKHETKLRRFLEGLSPEEQIEVMVRRPLVRVVVEPTATAALRSYYDLGSGASGTALAGNGDAPHVGRKARLRAIPARASLASPEGNQSGNGPPASLPAQTPRAKGGLEPGGSGGRETLKPARLAASQATAIRDVTVLPSPRRAL